MVLADLSRRVEFVDKLLFMESLVTGWKMLWENGGKDVFLFHDFSMHYPPGYQWWNDSLSIKSMLLLIICVTCERWITFCGIHCGILWRKKYTFWGKFFLNKKILNIWKPSKINALLISLGFFEQADNGNRTRLLSLGSWYTTDVLCLPIMK